MEDLKILSVIGCVYDTIDCSPDFRRCLVISIELHQKKDNNLLGQTKTTESTPSNSPSTMKTERPWCSPSSSTTVVIKTEENVLASSSISIKVKQEDPAATFAPLSLVKFPAIKAEEPQNKLGFRNGDEFPTSSAILAHLPQGLAASPYTMPQEPRCRCPSCGDDLVNDTTRTALLLPTAFPEEAVQIRHAAAIPVQASQYPPSPLTRLPFTNKRPACFPSTAKSTHTKCWTHTALKAALNSELGMGHEAFQKLLEALEATYDSPDPAENGWTWMASDSGSIWSAECRKLRFTEFDYELVQSVLGGDMKRRALTDDGYLQKIGFLLYHAAKAAKKKRMAKVKAAQNRDAWAQRL